MLVVGSSPLTRGAPVSLTVLEGPAGLIPAHAGSTSKWCGTARKLWAHPRSRGEHSDRCGAPRAARGSSPLTRGARAAYAPGASRAGLIPAHAGSTSIASHMASSVWAHPRSRGEHASGTSKNAMNFGSSPLTRGARKVQHLRNHGSGLIPAHAGSTAPFLPIGLDNRAHPRSRGEHSDRPGCRKSIAGSSPAHAGSTPVCPRSSWATPAHPRSRGEHDAAAKRTSGDFGSSPLTRGALDHQGDPVQIEGLIPAHAGSTCVSDVEPARGTAHPRSRGEHA